MFRSVNHCSLRPAIRVQEKLLSNQSQCRTSYLLGRDQHRRPIGNDSVWFVRH
jgi:hypothetical protein